MRVRFDMNGTESNLPCDSMMLTVPSHGPAKTFPSAMICTWIMDNPWAARAASVTPHFGCMPQLDLDHYTKRLSSSCFVELFPSDIYQSLSATSLLAFISFSASTPALDDQSTYSLCPHDDLSVGNGHIDQTRPDSDHYPKPA